MNTIYLLLLSMRRVKGNVKRFKYIIVAIILFQASILFNKTHIISTLCGW